MHKLVEVHLREPERFKSIMINIDGVDWLAFEEVCKLRGVTPSRAIADFIEETAKENNGL